MKKSARPWETTWWFVGAAIALLLLAFYQLTVIFWDAPMAQNEQTDTEQALRDESANLLRPAEMMLTMGGEALYSRLQPSDEAFDILFAPCYAVIEQVIQNAAQSGAAGSEAVSEQELPWQQAAVVLLYDFIIESDLIAAQLETSEGLPEGSWTQVWVVPASSQQESMRVYWLGDDGRCWKTEAGSYDAVQNQELLQQMLPIGTALPVDYVALASVWPYEFESASFRPELSQHATASSVTAVSAFLEEDAMYDYAISFFEYPETVTVKEGEDFCLFSNEKITVRIDREGHVQYVETLTDEEKEAVSMKEAYQLAYSFLNRDLERLGTEELGVRLAGYDAAQGRYEFVFSYTIGGIPYRMQQSKMTNWAMDDVIQITIEGSKVRRYERYALDITLQQGDEYQLRSTWLDAANQLTKKKWSLREAPQLVYYTAGKQMVLQWEAQTEEGRALLAAN